MIVSKSARAVARVRHPAWPPEGPALWITSYLGRDSSSPKNLPRPAPDELFPCAFLIEHEPGVDGPAHYHIENEFQIVIAGDGRFGKEPAGALTVHYAAGYSPYGPIVAGERGLSYMTLRDTYTGGARLMPQSRAELKAARVKPRQALAHCAQPGTDVCATLGAPECDTILARAADGLAAWLHRVPPGAAATGSDPAGSGGQFWLVVAGSQVHGTAELPVTSCTFVSADEGAFSAHAGAAGLAVLELQFPDRSQQR